jgi:HipA-like protein
MGLKNSKIIGIRVFLELRKKRKFVGTLNRIGNRFQFEYDPKYFKDRSIIPLGPEMPLTRRIYQSERLFVPFWDRIPPRENPAYGEYCQSMGISIEESDPFILLSTIAHRGPSSFIFEPLYEEDFGSQDLLTFRKSLGLTVKEFAACFDFSPAAITRTELKQSSGREVLKRAEIYARYPQVALGQFRKNGGALHTNKQQKVLSYLLELRSSQSAKDDSNMAC